jgi:hypothetical protein
MSRTISVSDFLLIDEFKGLRELDLVKPENDKRVLHYLEQLGFDTDYTIYYKPNKHRNMRGEVLVGFRIIGELSCNRKYYDIYSLEEIVAATGYTDMSLAKEMCNLTGKDIDYKAFHDAGVEDEIHHSKLHTTKALQREIMEDYRMIQSQIVALEECLMYIRGGLYNEDGSVKGLG